MFVCWLVCLLVGCSTSQQHAGISHRRICSDNFTCCQTEIEFADPIFYLTQSQYTDTGSTSPSADPITPGAWQGSHWSTNFEVTGMTRPSKILSQVEFEIRIFRSPGGRLNHEAFDVVFLTSQQHASVSQGRICSDSNPALSALEADALTTRPPTRLTLSNQPANKHTHSTPVNPSMDTVTPRVCPDGHQITAFFFFFFAFFFFLSEWYDWTVGGRGGRGWLGKRWGWQFSDKLAVLGNRYGIVPEMCVSVSIYITWPPWTMVYDFTTVLV